MPNKNVFVCSCGKEEMERPQFFEHLKSIHGIEKEQVKGTKQMVLHMDGAKFFSSIYRWTLESGLEFTEYFEATRTKKTQLPL